VPIYQKAYPLKALRRFAGWKEKTQSGSAPPLTDESIVFLQQDLTVTSDCFDTKQVIFDEVSPEWEEFCRNEAGFVVPDWEEESAHVRKKLAELSNNPT
jgi:hypothetical protein